MSPDDSASEQKTDISNRETMATPASPGASEFNFGSTSRSSVASDDSLLGVAVENYAIESLLGAGGFGAVYRARDVKLDRDVALKFLKNPLADDHRALFEREAKALARLSKHPSIVQIYGWGEFQKYVYFALEFVPASADSFLRHWPHGIPPSWALRIARETAAALGYAHTQGFLHRDVKPENILIDAATRRIKLADFGLVSIVDSDQPSILEGRISGSPPYMSPEQASAHPLDARSDIYSLGVTLYRLLSGQLPTESKTASAILQDIRADNRVPLSTRRPDLPKSILDIVDKALAFDPGNRYQAADEFVQALDAVLAKMPEGEDFFEASTTLHINTTKTDVALARRRGWLVPALSAVAALLVAGAAVLYFSGGNEDSPGMGIGIAEAAIQHLNNGEYTAAESVYRDLLRQRPGSSEFLYGMGYALLHQGQLGQAQTSFETMNAGPERDEGLAAVAYARDGEAARAQIEALAARGDTAYAHVLLAYIDLVAQRYDDVVSRLSELEERALNFKWQYAQGLSALGQAYFRLGQDQQARDIFTMIAAMAPSQAQGATFSVADAYLDMLRRKEDAALRESAIERAKEISERIQAGEVHVPTEDELWTSRPLRFLLLPAKPGKSRYAYETGLADVLPELLGRALDAHPQFDWIDRDELDITLAEQALTSYLASDGGKLQLGQLMGARLIVEGEFLSVFNEDSLTGKVVDAETTARLPLGEVPLTPGKPPREAVTELAQTFVETVTKNYPIRGRLVRTPDGLAVDVGAGLAVQPGARFVVLDRADVHARARDGIVLVVDEVLGSDRSRVRVEEGALDEASIPDSGLYLIDEQWHRERLGSGA